MLQIRNLEYSIGDRKLINNTNLVIQPAKRAALIGPNGTGKTTLLRILNDELQPDAGTIIKPKNYKIGYLPQEEVSIGENKILESVVEGHREIRNLEKRIAQLRIQLDEQGSDSEKLVHQISMLEHQFELLGGYALESTARKILTGLGFSKDQFGSDLSEFSGGWRMRVYLARLLLQQPDLLLLDEPTNHLDLPSLEWLEQFLLNFPGSMIIVSHDRFFIDRLSQEIFELVNGKLTHYQGNYHFYEREKEARTALLLKEIEEQKSEREHQEKFINRFRYKATKAAQVQSRIKQLEKMEKTELPDSHPRSIDFQILVDVQSYKDVLKIDKMSFRYDEDWVLNGINLDIYRGEKVALVGVNGAGKTTLTKLITGQLDPQEGAISIGKRTQIGYYAQHQVDTLKLDATVYDEVKSTVVTSRVPKIRDVLGIFGLSRDDVLKKIKVLSGGEKARVSLSKILLSPVNFLIMDEPTNHLDINSKEALEKALQNYDGALLLISHDRYFLDKLVTRVLELKNCSLKEYWGNYSDYLKRREKEKTEINQQESRFDKSVKSKKTKEQKQQEAMARQAISEQRKELNQEIKNLEMKIEQFENRQQELEAILADPITYQKGELISEIQKEYTAKKKDLQSFYYRWEQVQIKLEKLLNAA